MYVVASTRIHTCLDKETSHIATTVKVSKVVHTAVNDHA